MHALKFIETKQKFIVNCEQRLFENIIIYKIVYSQNNDHNFTKYLFGYSFNIRITESTGFSKQI